MKINSIIVDDEPIAREGLKNYIKKFDDIELIDSYKDALEVENNIRNLNTVDLIFLDINMPRLNGIEFLKRNKINQLVVITSAYSNFALESYDLNVIDYLLKPISLERFNKSIIKIREYLQYRNLQNNVNKKYIFIKNGNILQKIFITDILFLEASSNYYKIFTENNSYLQYGSLYKVQEELDSTLFKKVHRSYIVNITKIDGFNNKNIIIKKFTIPVSSSFDISQINK